MNILQTSGILHVLNWVFILFPKFYLTLWPFYGNSSQIYLKPYTCPEPQTGTPAACCPPPPQTTLANNGSEMELSSQSAAHMQCSL